MVRVFRDSDGIYDALGERSAYNFERSAYNFKGQCNGRGRICKTQQRGFGWEMITEHRGNLFQR